MSHITSVPLDRTTATTRVARHRPRPDEPARLPRPRARLLRLRRGPGLHEHLLLHGGVPRAPRLEPARHRDAARPSTASRSPSTPRASSSTSTRSRSGCPQTEKVAELFAKDIHIPTQDDWRELKASVKEHGIYNQNLQAVPPTGSISYINNSTSSIHPVASKIEIRKEGKLGRVYYPAPYMTNDNLEYYQDAYEIGYEKVIDTYAAATQHVDQGLSLTLFFKDTATTRDINKAQIYAWRKGIKTIYYIRLRQMALEGTEVEGCVSCML